MKCLSLRALPVLFLLFLALFFPLFMAANPSVALEATTTLDRLTSNNTSASSAFAAISNGDTAPGNVSKVSLKKMLPANFHGKVLAHWIPWWKCSRDGPQSRGRNAPSSSTRPEILSIRKCWT